MHHTYITPAIVVMRSPLGEASASLVLLTRELGLIRARVQGVRQSGAKLQSALQTLCEVDVSLVRGKESWRVSGARLLLNSARHLSPSARARAGRLAALLLRLVRGETHDGRLYDAFRGFLTSLQGASEESQDAAECLAALRLLHVLGHDTGDALGRADIYDGATLQQVLGNRTAIVARINHGIAASGL